MAGRPVTVPFCLGESWQVHVTCHTIHVSDLSAHVGDMNFSTLLKLDNIVSYCYHHCLAMQWDLLCIFCPGREGEKREGGREKEGERE